MSTGYHHEDSSEEMDAGLPPLKRSKETLDGLVRNFKFPDSWDARYPDEGQTTADAPAIFDCLQRSSFLTFCHITSSIFPRCTLLGWCVFVTLTLPVVGCVLKRRLIVSGYFTKCTVPKGSIRLSKGLLRKRLCCNLRNLFMIGSKNSLMQMIFRGKEDVPKETIQTPFSENWYQDLKDVPTIALPEKALVGASMSLNWRMNREDKPVYMEGDKVVSLYVVAFERECGKMATVPKRADEELWYLHIVKNFVLPRYEELAAYKEPKAEPRDIADIPPSNPDDPIDLESSPELLLKPKAGKGKQIDSKAEGQPAKKFQRKKITRKGNLDAFISKPVLEKPSSPVHAEPSSMKTAGAENPEVEKPADVAVESEKVTSPEAMDVDAGHPKSPEVADEVHAPVWKLKKGDTFSVWHVCRKWLQGTFPPGEIKFQEGRPHEQTYHSYLEEAASYTSTTHRIMREWHSTHKEWAAFKASKKKAAKDETRAALLWAKLEADQVKFKNDRKNEEWSVAGWKRKAEAEAALLSKESKNWKEICEKDNAVKMSFRNVISNLKAEVEKLKKQDAEIEKLKQEKAEAEAVHDEARSHRERSEQREEKLKVEVESVKKDLELERSEMAETSYRLVETEEKLENSKTAQATAEGELEPLKSDMLWLKERGIESVAESVLNSEELDKTVAHLLVAAWNDGYAQGYAECSHHVVNVLKVD
ncbi:hypothetical protein Hdeb2414_s0001g00017751 [Helianthus debilis subsp. tardiflorus]